MGKNPIEDIPTSLPTLDVPKHIFESTHQQQPPRPESAPGRRRCSRRLNSDSERRRACCSCLLERTECVNKALLYLRIAALTVAVLTIISAALALGRTTRSSEFDERLRHNALVFTGWTVAVEGLAIVVEALILTGILCLDIGLASIECGFILVDALLSIGIAVGLILGSVAMAALSHQWSTHDPAWGINSIPFTLASAAVFGLLDFILFFIQGVLTLVLAISKYCILLPRRAAVQI